MPYRNSDLKFGGSQLDFLLGLLILFCSVLRFAFQVLTCLRFWVMNGGVNTYTSICHYGGNVIDDICSSLSLQLCDFGNELDWIQEIEIGFD